MKRNLFTFISCLFLLTTGYGQTIYQVDTSPNALYDAVLQAEEGDIIELIESGEYRIDSLIYINKKLTIRATSDLADRPILRNYTPSVSPRFIFDITTGGNLSLEGLDLDGNAGSEFAAENIIQTTNVEGKYSLFINNCYLRNANLGEKGSFFRAYGGTFADTVKVTNSVLHNSGKIGIRINETEDAVTYFEFSNSSMFDVWTEGIYVQGSTIEFLVDHCTFNNVGYGTADIIRPRFILNAVVTNSIFSNLPEPHTRTMLLYGSSTLDYCAFYNVGRIDVHDSQAINMGDNILTDVDPQYFDVDNKDFSLLLTSPMLTYAEDGGTIGDPNWDNNRPFISSIIPVGSENNALYDSLQIARSGDILELTDAAEYQLDSLLFINKSITIRAAAGLATKPVLINVNPDFNTRFIFEIETGGNLALQGLDLDGGANTATPSKYLIKTADEVSGTYKLIIDDCILRDVVSGTDGNFFRGYSKTFADSVVIRNSILYNAGKEGIRIKDKDNTVKYFEISNSTMYDTYAEGIYVQGNEVEFNINYCTFNNIGYAKFELIRPRFILNTSIKNSIFSNVPEPRSKALEIYGGSVEYCDFYNVGSISVKDSMLVTIADNVLRDVDPQFADTSVANFTLLAGSPLYNISEDGTAIGDPRWALNTPTATNRVIPVGLEQNALYDSLAIAISGDILELTHVGDYLLDSLLNIDKKITVRAAASLDTKPVIKMINPDIGTRHLFQINTGGHLSLSGLDLDGIADSDTPVKYIIRTDEEIEGSYSLYVDNCILHDVVIGVDGNFFRAYSKTYADTVIFNDCILYNAGREGIRLKDSDNTVGYFQMTNSTMYDVATEGIYVQGNTVKFRIDHCTFNNLGYNHNEMVRPRYVVDSEIRNTIFANTPEPHSRTILFYGFSMANVNFFNVGSVSIHDTSAYTGFNVYDEDLDPVFEDQLNGDFTLLETSPMYFRGDNGEALGDPRWATNAPTSSTTNIDNGTIKLGQNYPNPFGVSTTIPIIVTNSERVTLKVYNLAGLEVATLYDDMLKAGNYKVNFNAANLESGVYFYKLTGQNNSMVRKMMLQK